MTDATACSIREARLEDAPALAELMNQLGYATTASEMTERLREIESNTAYHTLVALRQAKVVGVVGVGLAHYYERNGRYARILVLSVADGERRLGIGGKLLAAAEAWARAAGASDVIVNSGSHRTDAQAFYERHGYRPTGLRFVKALGGVA